MSDENLISEEGEPPTFEELCIQAHTLDVADYNGGVELLTIGHAQGFPEWQMYTLANYVAKSLGVPPQSFSKILRDLRNTHERHGRLATNKQVAAALALDLAENDDHLRMSNGTLFVYQSDPRHANYGRFEPIRDSRLNSILMTDYSPQVPSAGARREVIDLLKNGVGDMDSDAFAEAPTGIAVLNGFLAYNDDTGQFDCRPHSPENLARNKLAITYDPSKEALLFEHALLRVLGAHVACVALLQFMACTVLGRRPSQDSVRGCLLLVGPPRTGKSTIIELLRMLIVPEQVAHLAPNLWGKPENLASLASATLCVCTELDPRARLKGAIIKQILSGELVNARHMRQTIFSFSCWANHVWATNELPRIDEINPSLVRRFLCIRTTESLSDLEAQTSLIDIAIDEASGLLNLLLNAFATVQAAGRYDLPPESDLIVAQMQLGNDLAALFVRQCVVAVPGAKLWTHEIKVALASFARDLGMDADLIDTGTLRVSVR